MLKDSSGYEFDPTVVVAMVAWLESVATRLGVAVDRLTVDELLAACEPVGTQREPRSPHRDLDEHGQAQACADSCRPRRLVRTCSG